MGGSYAFSVIGFSGTTAGGGNTEDTRSNTGSNIVSVRQLPRRGLVQVGGYAQGNGAKPIIPGASRLRLCHGFSFDAIGSYAQDSVHMRNVEWTPVPPSRRPTRSRRRSRTIPASCCSGNTLGTTHVVWRLRSDRVREPHQPMVDAPGASSPRSAVYGDESRRQILHARILPSLLDGREIRVHSRLGRHGRVLPLQSRVL